MCTRTRHFARAEVREQLLARSQLPPSAMGWDSGCQAWQWAPSPTEPLLCPRPPTHVLKTLFHCQKVRLKWTHSQVPEKNILQNSYVRKQYEDAQRSLVLGTHGTDQVEYLIHLVFIKKTMYLSRVGVSPVTRGVGVTGRELSWTRCLEGVSINSPFQSGHRLGPAMPYGLWTVLIRRKT